MLPYSHRIIGTTAQRLTRLHAVSRSYTLNPIAHNGIMIGLGIINRYLFKELLGPFITSLLTFSAIMLMGRTLKLSDLLVNKGLGIIDILQLISYIFIPFLGYIIPMSLLLTILLALGRLSADNEITAMKSSGISLYQIVFPIGVFACGAFLLTTILTLYAYPWGFRSLRNFAFKVAKTQSEVGIQERVFNDDFEGMVIYIDKAPVSGGTLQGVFISDKRDPTMSTTIVAKEAYIESDPVSMVVNLRLFDGNFHRAGNEAHSYQMGRFTTYDITLDLTASFNELKKKKKKFREMTLTELKDSIDTQAHDIPHLNEIKIEYYKKFTIPFACFVFGLLGIPLGIRKVRGGKSYGFIMSLIIILIYYLLLITAESVGKSGAIPPLISMWLPNITLGALGIYLFNTAARESSPPIVTWTSRLTHQTAAYLKKHLLRSS
jgi:lipopolysaccharide export system permease protein